jgi:TRAP-type C4-dicarboxylate transport system substrate-binding protein
MRRRLKYALALLLGLASISNGLFAGGGREKVRAETSVILRMSTVYALKSPIIEGLKEWAANVAEKSGGGIIVQIYPASQLGSNSEVMEKAAAGANVACLAGWAEQLSVDGLYALADWYEGPRYFVSLNRLIGDGELLKQVNAPGASAYYRSIVVGERWFSSLPGTYQKILAEECEAAAKENALLMQKLERGFEKSMRDQGMFMVNLNHIGEKIR